jgi:hypothetical protein
LFNGDSLSFKIWNAILYDYLCIQLSIKYFEHYSVFGVNFIRKLSVFKDVLFFLFDYVVVMDNFIAHLSSKVIDSVSDLIQDVLSAIELESIFVVFD